MLRNKLIPYILGGGLIILIGVFLFYQGYKIYQEAENAALDSCLLSIRSSIIKTIETNKEIRNRLNPDVKWRTLTRNEREMLFDSISNPKSLDCPNPSFLAEGKGRDGKELNMSIREMDGKIDISIEGVE